MKILEQSVKFVQWRRFGVFIPDFKQILHIVLVLLLLKLNK